MNSYKTGILAESIAAWGLRLKGYRILARRYKTPVGEVDLIACKGQTLVMVEVKNRAGLDDALTAVTPTMQRRITKAALHYLSVHPQYRDYTIRFDLIACALPFAWKHLDNAWEGE